MPRKSSISPEEQERRKTALLQAVEKLRGLHSFADIAKKAGYDPTELRKALNELLEEGRVVRRGQRRGARYSLGNPDESRSSEEGHEEQADVPAEPGAVPWLRPGVKYTIAEAARHIHEQFGKSLYESYQLVTTMAKSGEINHLRSRDDGNRLLYFVD